MLVLSVSSSSRKIVQVAKLLKNGNFGPKRSIDWKWMEKLVKTIGSGWWVTHQQSLPPKSTRKQLGASNASKMSDRCRSATVTSSSFSCPWWCIKIWPWADPGSHDRCTKITWNELGYGGNPLVGASGRQAEKGSRDNMLARRPLAERKVDSEGTLAYQRDPLELMILEVHQ